MLPSSVRAFASANQPDSYFKYTGPWTLFSGVKPSTDGVDNVILNMPGVHCAYSVMSEASSEMFVDVF